MFLCVYICTSIYGDALNTHTHTYICIIKKHFYFNVYVILAYSLIVIFLFKIHLCKKFAKNAIKTQKKTLNHTVSAICKKSAIQNSICKKSATHRPTQSTNNLQKFHQNQRRCVSLADHDVDTCQKNAELLTCSSCFLHGHSAEISQES